MQLDPHITGDRRSNVSCIDRNWVTPYSRTASDGTLMCVWGEWGGGTVDVRACVLLDCADEQKPWPAVSEGIKPLNDTKLQGSPSAQRIRRCLCRFNGIASGWMAAITLSTLLKLKAINKRMFYKSNSNFRGKIGPIAFKFYQDLNIIKHIKLYY